VDGFGVGLHRAVNALRKLTDNVEDEVCLQGLCSTDKLVVITGVNWSYYHASNNPIYNTFLDFVNNYGFWATFVKRFALSYRTVVCPVLSVLSATLVYCG